MCLDLGGLSKAQKLSRERGDPARSSLRASSPSWEYREKETHERHAREDAKASGGGFAARFSRPNMRACLTC